ncbi:MAG TPA: NAD-dependent epimerase/dehydratase family protein [Gemmatimonadota bacterium]|nr:NAD-dependent epimerase/dehydratase family protein [Gemmatimonadota bacterium]
MDVLIIGGTRNVGHHLVEALSDLGHRVTVLNRGRTPDELGAQIERLRADRTDSGQLARVLGRRSFDACVDTIAMRGEDTQAAIETLDGRVGHYIHLSTGQVYLVRAACPVPAREEDYDGPLVDPPPDDSWEAAEWRYGIEKRECEDILEEAWTGRGFPATRLRLPMIHGPRDHYGRIHGLVCRLLDGGPLLIPLEGGPGIRHIDQADVVAAILHLLETGAGMGTAYNLAQDDQWSLHEFLGRVAAVLGVEPDIVPLPRAVLEAAGLFPACCPFASPWMSVLDTRRAKENLGLTFMGFDDYLPDLVDRFRDHDLEPPPSYVRHRDRERALAGRPEFLP